MRILFQMVAGALAVFSLGLQAAPPRETDQPPSAETLQKVDSNIHNSDRSKETPKLVVVVSRKNPIESLDLAELRRILLRQKTRWKNGWSITVFERSFDNPLRKEISKRVLNKTHGELKEYWMNLHLTRGLKTPKVLRSAKLVRKYLQRVKGGVGYMYDHEVNDTVKIVRIEGLEDGKQ